jgi:vitamin B12 transporter
MRKKICAALVFSFLTGTAFAWADSEADQTIVTMGEVVVTATRSAEKISEIPARVEVIDEQTIARTAGETITDQLKKNSSLAVIEYPGALAGIGIRGFRPEYSGITKHSLVLLNGRPAGATNLATILSDNIERIEVLKGPASSLYGGEAMGGVVNIITTKNSGEPTGRAELGFGSFQTNFQKAAVGGSLGERLDFDLSARRFEQADDFKMGNGKSRANTGYKTRNAAVRLGADLGANFRADLSGDLYQGRDIESPGDIYFGDNKAGHKDIDRYGLDFGITGKAGRNKLSLTAYTANETSESHNHYTGYSTPVPVAPYRSYDTETDWVGLQLKDEISWHRHRFIAGIDYQNISKESRSYNQDGSRKAPYSPDEGRENWAGYLETIWKFMDERLTATLGGRYDAFEVETKPTPYKTDFTPNSETFSAFSPRAGLNYLTGLGLRLHATIGKAFVPPSAWELAGYSDEGPNITRGNPGLDPESSLTYDFGVGFEKPVWGLSLDLTYFHTDVDDKISRVTNGAVTTYENSLSAEMAGLETELSLDIGAPLKWDRSLTLFVNATHMFQAEEEQSDGTMKDIQNVAKYTVNYGIQYDDGLFDSKLHVRQRGRMKDTDWNTAGYPEVEYPSFTVVDLVVGVSFFDRHRLKFTAENLFDEDYYEKIGFPKPGRAFYVSYRYEF